MRVSATEALAWFYVISFCWLVIVTAPTFYL